MRVEVDAEMPGLDGFEAGHRNRLAAVAQRAQLLMHDHVPMEQGTLRGSTGGSDYGSGRIVYDTPYANYQYRLHTANRTTDGTDGEWDVAMMAESGDDLMEFAAQLARRDLG